VVDLRFPDTAVNGTEPGNLHIMIGVLPAVALVVVPAAIPSINPFLVSIGGFAVSLVAVAVGWLSVRRWLNVKNLLSRTRPSGLRR
jgi:hypothetical protein